MMSRASPYTIKELQAHQPTKTDKRAATDAVKTMSDMGHAESVRMGSNGLTENLFSVNPELDSRSGSHIP
jgi:hypothetical protein